MPKMSQILNNPFDPKTVVTLQNKAHAHRLEMSCLVSVRECCALPESVSSIAFLHLLLKAGLFFLTFDLA